MVQFENLGHSHPLATPAPSTGGRMNPHHVSDAHALIRDTARSDRTLNERQLRSYLLTHQCQFLARHTGLPFSEVVEIYEETPIT